jgi:hypothetical protein
VTLYFFERISETDFIGPVIVAATTEAEAWALLARREGAAPDLLKDLGWDIAQELAAIPARPAIVYPASYRRAIR